MDRTSPDRPPGYPAPVLTDEQADEIRRELEAGVRGPVLIKWVRLLLDGRGERFGRSRPDERPAARRRPEHSRSGR